MNDTVYNVARYPNEGYLTINNIIENGGIPRDDPENPDLTPFKIKLEGEAEQRSAHWTTAKDALIFGKFCQDWADQTVSLKSVSGGVIESGRASLYGLRKGGTFYIYNLLEELDTEGEYYCDVEKNRLYLYPPKGNIDVTMSLLNDTMFTFDGVENVTFRNINMGASCGQAFEISGDSKNVALDGGVIRFIQDKTGIIGGKGTKYCGIKNYYIHDTDGGVDVTAGNSETLETAECFIENCDFERFARLTITYNPAIGVGNHIRHNKIHDALHLGMTGGGIKNDISYNEFYDLVKETDDAGAVYGGRTYLCRGNVYKYNYFHDLKSTVEGSFGVHGIYFDDGFCGAIAVGNVFENLTGSAIFYAGKDNYAANNIFINIEKSSITLSPRQIGTGTSLDVSEYLLDSLKGTPYKNEYWQKEFPEVYNAETDIMKNQELIVVDIEIPPNNGGTIFLLFQKNA